MNLDWSTLLAILAMAAATYLTRIVGFWLARFLSISGRVKAALDAVPPAILMAVIAPTAFATGWAETAAAGITVLAALRLPFILAVVTGVVSVVALRWMLA